MRIMCYGDSNTWGYMPGTGARYPHNVRWTGVLKELLEAEIVEEGLNGRTTAFDDNLEPFRNGLDYAAPCVMSHNPLDYIIIMLGTNDAKRRFHVSAQEIRFGMEELIMRMQEYLRRTGQNPKLLVISPPSINVDYEMEFDVESEKKIQQLEKEYEEMTREFDCLFLKASDYAKEIGEDGIHISPIAHRQLAEAIAKKLQSRMKSIN